MTVKKILRMGDPRLLEPSKPIENVPSKELDQLIQDMLDTMEEYEGAGLAAPQIGEFQRLVVFGVDSNERYPDTEQVPLTILINPEIEAIGDEIVESWEGCLSIPGMRGLVPRHSKVRYKGLDQFGNIIDREVGGFHAIVVQHECDHLDGILYPMRVPDMSYFGFEEELSQPISE
jgi:peptide deformylase